MNLPKIGQGVDGFPWEDILASSQNEKEFIRCLRLGVDLGLRLIDTAEVYGEGVSETLIGKAISGIRDKVFIASKFSAENSSRSRVLHSVENTLKRLGIETLDLYQAHWPNLTVPFQETAEALNLLYQQGKIKSVGLSNFTLGEIKTASSFLSSGLLKFVQHEYNFLERTIEKSIIPYCVDQKLNVLAYSPLIRGGTTGLKKKFSNLEPLCNKLNISISQLSLAWLIHQPGVIPIPKASKEVHIRENAASAFVSLSKEDLDFVSNQCATKLKLITPQEILVASAANRNVYQTLSEAIENRFNMVPSPVQLSEQILRGDVLKPIKVKLRGSTTGPAYELLDGRTRFWAWVIATQGAQPIEAIVEEEN